jgi:hypothetical protein
MEMPRRVRPYGTAVDTESAAAARGWPRARSEFVSELASALTVRDIARQAAETIRALAEVSADGVEVACVDDARDMVESLERIGQELPQISEQLARILVVASENGQIRHSAGEDPEDSIAEAVEALDAAGQGADMMAAALTQASETLAEIRPAR